MNTLQLERKYTNALRIFGSLIIQKCNTFWVIFTFFPLFSSLTRTPASTLSQSLSLSFSQCPL